jgi:hypothetical protein
VTHEEAQELIPALLTSRLQGSALEELRAHFRDCDGCAGVLSGIGEIVDTIREDGRELFQPHPDEKAIRAYFEGWRSPETARIEQHIRSCASCSLELSTKTRQPSREADRAPVSSPSYTRAGQLRAAAALIGVGVLLGAGLAALWPRQSSLPAARAGALSSWSGAVDLHLLPAPTRKEESVTRFTLRKGQPATILHLPKVIPGAGSPDEKFKIVVRRPSLAPVFDQSYTRSEMMKAFDSWSVMPILLPASSLPAGRYELIVSREADPSDQVAVIPFEIVREE